MIDNEDGASISNSGSDQSALEAVSSFFSQGNREEAARQEVPDAGSVSYGLPVDANEQQEELEQEGIIDGNNPDGSLPPEKTEKTVQNTPKPALSKERVAPVGEAQESGLDPVLRAIAEESGWTPEKIERFYKADPELAVETFESMADSYAKLSRQFLEQNPGVQTPASSQVPTAQSPVNGGTVTQPQLPAELTDEAIKKFGEQNGEDGAKLLTSLRNHFVTSNSALENRVRAFEAKLQEAETATIGNEAKSTLSGLVEKFPKLYGNTDNPETLTLAQYQKQVELASMADQIRAGAKAQGRTLSVKDAMQRAHYIVSRDSIKSETRKEISQQVRQRSSGATARPSQRINPTAPGNSRSDSTAVNAAAEKMAEIGLND